MEKLSKYFNEYSLLGLLRLTYCAVRTKLFYPNAKIIRFPIDIRGRKFIEWGKDFTTGFGCRLEAYPPDGRSKTLHIGQGVQINDYVHITAMQGIVIEDNVLIASKVYISDCTHGFYAGTEKDSSPMIPPKDRPYDMKPIVIKKNAWLGEHVSVLPGVTIGEGTIVGANSVVTKDLPPFVIAVGVPAKPIKSYNFDQQKWLKFSNNE